MDEAILDYARRGGTVVGVCGGYQMLGRELRDPHRIETSAETMAGLDYLNDPEAAEKQQGTHLESGERIVGYEIHHGKTSTNLRPVLQFDDGKTCGSSSADNRIWGAYLHGIFDKDRFRRWFIDRLRVHKKLSPKGDEGTSYNVDNSLDELADLIRSSVDIEKIYGLMNLES